MNKIRKWLLSKKTQKAPPEGARFMTARGWQPMEQGPLRRTIYLTKERRAQLDRSWGTLSSEDKEYLHCLYSGDPYYVESPARFLPPSGTVIDASTYPDDEG